MARTIRSWGHACWRLTARQIDHADRWGLVCAVAPKCQGQRVGAVYWCYITGQRGRASDTERGACEAHLTRFAAKHEIQIADAPAAEPPQRQGIIEAAVAAWNKPGGWIKVEAYGHGRNTWLITDYSPDNPLWLSATTQYLPDVPAGATLEQAVPAVERYLAARRRLVPAQPWTITDRDARAPVAAAEDTPAWRDTPWQVTVAVDRHGVWQAITVLDPRFRPHTEALGDTNMTLARAVQAATAEMGDGWDLGKWTIHDQHATTTATRKALAHAE
jgi:hypothetical protein